MLGCVVVLISGRVTDTGVLCILPLLYLAACTVGRETCEVLICCSSRSCIEEVRGIAPRLPGRWYELFSAVDVVLRDRESSANTGTWTMLRFRHHNIGSFMGHKCSRNMEFIFR